MTWTVPGGSAVLTVANGSFLLNAALLNRARRPLAIRAVDWLGPGPRKVAFVDGAKVLEAGRRGRRRPRRSGCLQVPPFGWVVGHLAAFGVLLCLSLAATLGRPRPAPSSGTERPSAHPEALGSLLARTGRADFARPSWKPTAAGDAPPRPPPPGPADPPTPRPEPHAHEPERRDPVPPRAAPEPRPRGRRPRLAPAPSDGPVARWAARVLAEVNKVYVGQDELVRGVLAALLAEGHVLIESVPGLGKTLLVRALGRVLGCDFKRIQFTPDLMPSDVTGSPVYDERQHDFRFRPGPVFTQLLLADEINRAPAKTHSALLEIMQEYRVTVDGTSHPIARPFLVLATQNPIESEGTYNLPEAQLDRFLFKLVAGYPGAAEETEILRLHTLGTSARRPRRRRAPRP